MGRSKIIFSIFVGIFFIVACKDSSDKATASSSSLPVETNVESSKVAMYKKDSCHTCFEATKKDTEKVIERSDKYRFCRDDVIVYSKDGESKIGMISKGFGGDEVGTIGDKVILHIKGYKQDGDDKVIYADKEFAVPVLTFDADFMQDGAIEIALDKKDITSDENDIWSRAEFVYYDNCSMCHAAKNPKEHTVQEWDGIYGAMKAFAMPTEEDDKLIWEYLRAHSKGSFALGE